MTALRVMLLPGAVLPAALAYEALIATDLDDTTRGLLEDILTTERNHERELGGKWMMA